MDKVHNGGVWEEWYYRVSSEKICQEETKWKCQRYKCGEQLQNQSVGARETSEEDDGGEESVQEPPEDDTEAELQDGGEEGGGEEEDEAGAGNVEPEETSEPSPNSSPATNNRLQIAQKLVKIGLHTLWFWSCIEIRFKQAYKVSSHHFKW